MSTETEREIGELERRLRDRAAKELNAEINEAFQPIMRLMAGCSWEIKIPNLTSPDKTTTGLMADCLKNAIYHRHLTGRQKNAVDEFLVEVNELKRKVDDLQLAASDENE